MKKTLSIALVFCLFLTSSIQAQQETISNPEKRLLEYLQAIKTTDFKTAYQYLSENDQMNFTEQQFTVMIQEQNPFGQKLTASIEYQIIQSERFGEHIKIKVQKKEAKQLNVVEEVLIKELDGEQEEVYDDWEQKDIDEADLDFQKMTETYYLIEEVEGWKVWLDIQNTNNKQNLLEKAENLTDYKEYQRALDYYGKVLAFGPDPEIDLAVKSVQEKIKERKAKSLKTETLLREAEQLEADKKYWSAEKVYRKALSFDNQSNVALNGIRRVRSRRDGVLKKVYIKDIKVEDRVFSGRTVNAKIFNYSESDLGLVRVNVLFLNDQNEVVAEKEHFPVWHSEVAFGKKRFVLKSGEFRDFQVSANEIDETWNQKVRIEIVGVNFV